jgi:hypothetical protein
MTPTQSTEKRMAKLKPTDDLATPAELRELFSGGDDEISGPDLNAVRVVAVCDGEWRREEAGGVLLDLWRFWIDPEREGA